RGADKENCRGDHPARSTHRKENAVDLRNFATRRRRAVSKRAGKLGGRPIPTDTCPDPARGQSRARDAPSFSRSLVGRRQRNLHAEKTDPLLGLGLGNVAASGEAEDQSGGFRNQYAPARVSRQAIAPAVKVQSSAIVFRRMDILAVQLLRHACGVSAQAAEFWSVESGQHLREL